MLGLGLILCPLNAGDLVLWVPPALEPVSVLA